MASQLVQSIYPLTGPLTMLSGRKFDWTSMMVDILTVLVKLRVSLIFPTKLTIVESCGLSE